jgi:phosphoribosylglycinamide formyltransferase-1
MPARDDPRLARLSELCLSLPGAVRENLGDHAAFLVRGRKFAYFLDDHHGDGRIAVTCRMVLEEQEALLAPDHDRFFRPAYLGSRGWIGIRLDLGEADWVEVEDFVTDSYNLAAVPSHSVVRSVSSRTLPSGSSR